MSKVGADRMAQILTTQLLVEIERVAVEKHCDILNKIKLFEAVQEINKPIRRFESRLRILASPPGTQASLAQRPTPRQSSFWPW